MTGWRIVDAAPVAIDAAVPAPGVDDVVIEVEGAWIAPAVRRPDLVGGSAAVGRIVDAGDQARALVGTRGLVGPHLACGDCEVCRRGGAAVCPRGATLGVDRDGTLAARVTVPARWVVRFGDDLDVPGPAAAAIAGELAIAYAMYARASIGPREPAVVVGDDAVARFLVPVLAAKGVTAVDAGAGDPAAVAAALAAQGHAGKPVRVFATTVAARAAALALAGPRATLIARVVPGAGDPGVTVTGPALAHEVAVHAVVGAHPDLLLEVAALVVRGEIALADGVVVVPITGLAAALAAPGARSIVVAP